MVDRSRNVIKILIQSDLRKCQPIKTRVSFCKLNFGITIKGTVTRGAQPPVGPTGGYEFTLPGYQQATRGATEKRTHSEQSGKSGSSGYQSHVTGVHHVSEKRSSNYSRQQVKLTGQK